MSATERSIVRRLVARSWLALSMLVTSAFVLAGAVWSAASEREAALSDFSNRQALLATAVAADFENRLTFLEQTRPAAAGTFVDEAVLELLAGTRQLERPQEQLMVMVARPGAAAFLTTDGRTIPSSRLRAALDAGDGTVALTRDEAAVFGLPRRLAMAGLARIVHHPSGAWGVVVLASASRVRDRHIHEEWRLAATVVLVALAGMALGIVARRRERRELELERKVAIAALERDRETALARADKMAAVAALSTGIAHELGTPLGVIVGRVEQVLERGADDRSRAALDVVLQQVDRIREIVRGCLALARGDSPRLVATSPRSVAERAVSLVLHRFASAGVALDHRFDDDLPTFSCEPALFEQALVNLLLNACEATPRGGRVHLAVRRGGDALEFVVDDEGAGIPDAVARHATEPFFSTRREQGGSGLGLAIAREIVTHHAGELRLSRREGATGTRATIALGT